jgi:hypothetical protein
MAVGESGVWLCRMCAAHITSASIKPLQNSLPNKRPTLTDVPNMGEINVLRDIRQPRARSRERFSLSPKKKKKERKPMRAHSAGSAVPDSTVIRFP